MFQDSNQPERVFIVDNGRLAEKAGCSVRFVCL